MVPLQGPFKTFLFFFQYKKGHLFEKKNSFFRSKSVLQKIAPTTRNERIVHYNKKPSYTHFVLRSILCKSCFCCPALLSLDEYNDKVMILTKFLLECVSFAKRNNQIHYCYAARLKLAYKNYFQGIKEIPCLLALKEEKGQFLAVLTQAILRGIKNPSFIWMRIAI